MAELIYSLVLLAIVQKNTGLGSGTVLQCLYRLEMWGWLGPRLPRATRPVDGPRPRR